MGLNELDAGLRELYGTYGGFSGPMPDIAGKYEGRKLVICADGACVWDDLEALGCASRVGKGSVQKEGWDFMTVNKLGEVFPGRIEHWYSNEGLKLKSFVEARRYEYHHEFGGPNHTHSCNKGAKWHWPWTGHGTSGLGSILTGLALGYGEIVICGMPLDNGPHNGEPHWRQSRFRNEAPETKDGEANTHWKKAIQMAFQGKVRSMSGRSREWITRYSDPV